MNLMLANLWLPNCGDLSLFAPELVLIFTIVALLVVPIFTGRRPLVSATIALLGAIGGLLSTWWPTELVAGGGLGAFTPAGIAPLLVADSFSIFFKLFLLMLLAVIVWLWIIGISERDRRVTMAGGAGGLGAAEFFVLLLTSAVGMLLMVSSLNLLVIIVAMETASLPSYAFVASDRRSRLGAEAALKYVMFGAVSAALMVYGVSLLYGAYGSLDLGQIAIRLGNGSSPDAIFWLGLAGLGAGILFKIAAVPMHLWCPDVFVGAPVEVTTWLSVASKAAGLGLLLRVVGAFSVLDPEAFVNRALPLAIGVIAAVTCTLGNLAALRQDSVKRTLAYSSIAHAGYMMMAAAILANGSYSAGAAAVIAYLFVYVVMNVGAFGATALVTWHAGTDHISAFTGLGRRAPWLALPFALCLFSLIGLPPLGGFAAKWFLILALGRSAAEQHPWLWWLVGIAVVNTAISLYYYVRIIRQMYLVDDEQRPAFVPAPGGIALVSACALVLLLLGTFWFSPLGRRATLLASRLFEPAPAAYAIQHQPR
jgi:NADH-quinone oxidoreductase subunit N